MTDPTQRTPEPTPSSAPSQTPPPPTTSWAAPPAPSSTSPGAFDFSAFLNFRYFITPAFVTVIWVVGAAFITLAALASLTQGTAGIISGLIVFFIGNLIWRVYMEFVMVLFRINDSVQSIDRRGRGT